MLVVIDRTGVAPDTRPVVKWAEILLAMALVSGARLAVHVLVANR